MLKCFQAMTDQFAEMLGPLHKETVDYRLPILWHSEQRGVSPDLLFRQYLHNCELDLAQHDTRLLGVRLDSANHCLREGDFTQAEDLARAIVGQSGELLNQRQRCWFISQALILLAESQYALGQTQAAIKTLAEAGDVAVWRQVGETRDEAQYSLLRSRNI